MQAVLGVDEWTQAVFFYLNTVEKKKVTNATHSFPLSLYWMNECENDRANTCMTPSGPTSSMLVFWTEIISSWDFDARMPKFFPNYSSYIDNDKFGRSRYDWVCKHYRWNFQSCFEKGGIKINTVVQLGQSPTTNANGGIWVDQCKNMFIFLIHNLTSWFRI